jgi:hypothetical protein
MTKISVTVCEGCEDQNEELKPVNTFANCTFTKSTIWFSGAFVEDYM